MKSINALAVLLLVGLTSCMVKPVVEESVRLPNQVKNKKNICDKLSDKLVVGAKVFFADKEYTLKALTSSEAVIANSEGMRKVQPLQLYFGSGVNVCARAYKGGLTPGSVVYFNDQEYQVKAFDYKYGGAVISKDGELRTVDINHIQFSIEEEEKNRSCDKPNDKLVIGTKVFFVDKEYTLKALTSSEAVIANSEGMRKVQPLQLYYGYGVNQCVRTYKDVVVPGSVVYFNDQEYKVKAFDYRYGAAVISKDGDLRTVDINHMSY